MLLEGHRAFSHAAPTTYKRITPKRGCGFILARLAKLDDSPFGPGLTKEDVYLGTPWNHRPGFASVLWTALLEDGLIESEDGMVEYDGNYSCFQRRGKKYARANGHYELGRGWTVRYRLTDKGRRIYEEMMTRVNKVLEDKKEFCKRNGIQFGTGKTLPTIEEFDEKIGPVGLLTVAEYDAKKDEEVPPSPAEREFNVKQKLDAIINDLMDLRDSLS